MTIEELKAKHAEYQYLKDEKSQLAAVTRNGYALKYCANASEAVQLAAVQNDGNALKYCKF